MPDEAEPRNFVPDVPAIRVAFQLTISAAGDAELLPPIEVTPEEATPGLDNMESRVRPRLLKNRSARAPSPIRARDFLVAALTQPTGENSRTKLQNIDVNSTAQCRLPALFSDRREPPNVLIIRLYFVRAKRHTKTVRFTEFLSIAVLRGCYSSG